MIDLKSTLDDPLLIEILSHAIYPDPDRIERALGAYRSRDDLVLRGLQVDGRLVGCIGLELLGDRSATIRHIAVATDKRGMGVGRALVERALAEFRLDRVDAQTDRDAAGFYRRLDFALTSLGEQYPGVERFHCVLERRREP